MNPEMDPWIQVVLFSIQNGDKTTGGQSRSPQAQKEKGTTDPSRARNNFQLRWPKASVLSSLSSASFVSPTRIQDFGQRGTDLSTSSITLQGAVPANFSSTTTPTHTILYPSPTHKTAFSTKQILHDFERTNIWSQMMPRPLGSLPHPRVHQDLKCSPHLKPSFVNTA